MHISLEASTILSSFDAKIDSYILPKVQGLVKMALFQSCLYLLYAGSTQIADRTKINVARQEALIKSIVFKIYVGHIS